MTENVITFVCVGGGFTLDESDCSKDTQNTKHNKMCDVHVYRELDWT